MPLSKEQYSPWIRTGHHCPAQPGWYEVDLILNVAYAFWTGEKWERSFGWPTAGNEHVWQFGADERLILPKYLDGTDVPRFPCAPCAWRGFLVLEDQTPERIVAEVFERDGVPEAEIEIQRAQPGDLDSPEPVES